eukprot:6214516-Pleurochrysis_carterae.AAC.1
MTFGVRSEECVRVSCECCGLRSRARRAAAFRVSVAVPSFVSACARVCVPGSGGQSKEHCTIHSVVYTLVVRRNEIECRAEEGHAVRGAFEQSGGATGWEWMPCRSASAEVKGRTIVQQVRAEQHRLENDAASERVNRVERMKRCGLRDAGPKGVAAGGRPWIRVDELVNVGPHFSLHGCAGAASLVTKERQPTEGHDGRLHHDAYRGGDRKQRAQCSHEFERSDGRGLRT